MTKRAVDVVGFALIVALAESAALAGVVPVPEPDVIGGVVALGLLGLGYRLVRSRFSR